MSITTDLHATIGSSRAWPHRVIVDRLPANSGKRKVYVELRSFKALVHIDGPIGHAKCGGCKGSVDLHDKWCRHCGAKLVWESQR